MMYFRVIALVGDQASRLQIQRRINRTRMTRIKRIDADLFRFLSTSENGDNPPDPRHPRSINPYTAVKIDLVYADPRARSARFQWRRSASVPLRRRPAID